MMISKIVVVCSGLLSMCLYASTEGIPSVDAHTHYNLHIENKPEGVYEWQNRDLIFVQARIPRKNIRSEIKVESVVMSRTRQLLHRWLLDRAAERRVDPVLSYGMELARKWCRRYYPMLEYVANWDFAGESICITREVGKEHISCAVFRRSDVLASLPKAYLEPVENRVWINGVERLVDQLFIREGSLSFVWKIGALDCLDVSRITKAEFPRIESKEFFNDLEKYLADANDTWQDVESPAKKEYLSVRSNILTYLTSSSVAMGFHRDAGRLLSPEENITFGLSSPMVVVKTNETRKTTTNQVFAATVITNRSTVSFGSVSDKVASIPCSNQVFVSSVSCDDKEIVETEVKTIVTTRRRIIRKTVSKYFGQPRFEVLFLSGGSLQNAPEGRLASGNLAEKSFFENISMEERENLILSALRENPGDKVLWNLYGRIFQSKKDYMGAVICFRNALRIDREYEFALTNLAITYRIMGKKHLATGIAMLARGVAKNDWCITRSEEVLSAKW